MKTTYRKDKSIKLSLKHLNDVYYIFVNIKDDKDFINEKLRSYLFGNEVYTEEEILKAKEIYEIQRNEIIRNQTAKRENLGDEW